MFLSLDNMAVLGLAPLKAETGDGERVFTLRAVLLHLKAGPPDHRIPLTFLLGCVGCVLPPLLHDSLFSQTQAPEVTCSAS